MMVRTIKSILTTLRTHGSYFNGGEDQVCFIADSELHGDWYSSRERDRWKEGREGWKHWHEGEVTGRGDMLGERGVRR
jgi:hypothetical protein